MKFLATVALLFASTSSFAAAPPTPWSWTLSGDVQGVAWEESCTVTVDAGKFTGTCKMSDDNTMYPVTGAVTGTDVAFIHGGQYEGSPLTISYRGKMAADGTMSGTVDVSPNGAGGTFTARTVKPAAPASAPKVKP